MSVLRYRILEAMLEARTSSYYPRGKGYEEAKAGTQMCYDTATAPKSGHVAVKNPFSVLYGEKRNFLIKREELRQEYHTPQVFARLELTKGQGHQPLAVARIAHSPAESFLGDSAWMRGERRWRNSTFDTRRYGRPFTLGATV